MSDTLLPTTNGYPPPRNAPQILTAAPQTPLRFQVRRLIAIAAVLLLSSFALVYFMYSPEVSTAVSAPVLHAPEGKGLEPNATDFITPPHSQTTNPTQYTSPNGPGTPWFRDAHPALHARLFLSRAQAEIAARGLNTCDGQLSERMVDGYIDAAVPYCEPFPGGNASITCFPARAPGSPNAWWPYKQAFCASRNLRHNPGWGSNTLAERGGFVGTCRMTDAGRDLRAEMAAGRENFLGTEFANTSLEEEQACGETITHPVLFVPRQDKWNPFHVGEDLVTTFLALLIFSRHSGPDFNASLPRALASALAPIANLQLIFQDKYLPTESPFAALYDRIGAWPPRRQAAEALGSDGRATCFADAMHSVGAGASLLSATGVGKRWRCASELVWGASLWLRWMWGLEANVAADDAVYLDKRQSGSSSPLPPIQVLFLSRDKLDAYTIHKNGWLNLWQEARHIENEPELVAGLRTGLAELCHTVTEIPGSTAQHNPNPDRHNCTFTDADLLPASWGTAYHPRETTALGPARALRFATLDPTTLALPAQLGMIGRADVVVSVHAGALGLTLFLPTGRASVVELFTTKAVGNNHFHNMAHMLGNEYVSIGVNKKVDVARVVTKVKEVVERRLTG
ncbi:hypothetical protein MKEN_00232900 [Mycena kentingensis (nom. inval.)]|nr:hypothetical protein MKEN_00232900 [Mycena kentingensis (nom. inval.)]